MGPHAAADETQRLADGRVVSLFSRSSSKGRSQADSVLDDASPPARALIEGSRRGRGLWRRLVAEVGPEAALEHLEVSHLTAMVDSTNAMVSDAMQQWRAGVISEVTILRKLDLMEDDVVPRFGVAFDYVRLASTRRESIEVTDAASEFLTALWVASRLYVLGSLTESEMQRSLEVKHAWTEVCDAWDVATGRAALPLVG